MTDTLGREGVSDPHARRMICLQRNDGATRSRRRRALDPQRAARRFDPIGEAAQAAVAVQPRAADGDGDATQRRLLGDQLAQRAFL